MTLVRRNYFAPQLFNEFFNDSFFNSENNEFADFNQPKANIIEKKDLFIVELSVPGYAKEDVKISLDKNYLSVSSEVEESNETILRNEFNINSFKRTFKLSDKVDFETISAKHENGILTVNIPLKEAAKMPEPREISVN